MRLGINIRTANTYCGGWDTLVARLTELNPAYVRTVCPRSYPHGDFQLLERIQRAINPVFVLTTKLQPTDTITHAMPDIEAIVTYCSAAGMKIMLEAPNEWDKILPTTNTAGNQAVREAYAPLELFTRNLLKLGLQTRTEVILPSLIRDYAPQIGFSWIEGKAIHNLHYYGHQGYEAWYDQQRYKIQATPCARKFITEFGYRREELPMGNPNDVFRWQLDRFKAFEAAILFELADNTSQNQFGLLDTTGTPRNPAYWTETVALFKAYNS